MPADAAAVVFTIGHSTHSLEAFAGLLAGHGIGDVVDVRRFPRSRRHPHFDAEALGAGLQARSVGYRHLEPLGGRREPRRNSSNLGWEHPAFRGYADHMEGRAFAEGLEELERVARARPTAVLCAESLWWRCHRRLIADALLVRGWEVLHIGPAGTVESHALTPFAVLAGGRLAYPPRQLTLP